MWTGLRAEVAAEFAAVQPVLVWPARFRYRDQRDYMRVYYATHKLQWRERYLAARDRIKARNKARYHEHNEAMRAKRRDYYRRRRDKVLADCAKYRARHGEALRARKRAAYHRDRTDELLERKRVASRAAYARQKAQRAAT